MTEQFDENVMERFGGACVRIDNQQQFFEALVKKRGTPTPYGKQRIGNGVLATCKYEERERHYSVDSNTHPCFAKPPGYAHQAEVRAIWEPTKRPIEPWPIKCPEAMKFCNPLSLTAISFPIRTLLRFK